MEDSTRRALERNPSFRLFRFIAPWLLLAIIAFLVWGYANRFQADRARAAAEASSTTTPTAEAAATIITQSGLILTDGVHLRDAPSIGGEVLADMKKGMVVGVFEHKGAWYRVQGAGKIGWVSDNPKYMSVSQKAK